jgi:hypothetical protein
LTKESRYAIIADMQILLTRRARISPVVSREQRGTVGVSLFFRSLNHRRPRISAGSEISMADNFPQKQRKQRKQRKQQECPVSLSEHQRPVVFAGTN